LTPLGLLAAVSVFVVDEGVRVDKSAAKEVTARAQSAVVEAVRGEHAAFQVIVESTDTPVEQIRLELGSRDLRFEAFVEHFVPVERRSRNDDPEQASLAFTLAARPPDRAVLGTIPDALIPLAIAPAWAYPVSLASGERAAFWVEVFVPEDKPAGWYQDELKVTFDRGSAAVAVRLRVLDPVLPYRATSAFAYYERPTLEKRFLDADVAERQLVQLLHAHRLDSLCQITSVEHARRVRGALDGSWFTEAAGYRGPGVSVGAALAAIGTYGTLGEPSADKVESVRRIAAEIPDSVEDVFVYAIDETCDSPRGPRWQALLRDFGLWPRVVAGHTCHEDPRDRNVDLVMVPAQAFDVDTAAGARALGKRVWVYNGQLPYAAPPVLDVPLTSLAYNGWIAASYDVGRWFYWETIFWHDRNRGGKGPTDVFANVETFHNADGDTSLYDGLLLFPGRTPPRLGRHDLSFDGVVPSMRLKSLRRGLEDAGLLALAAQVDVAAADSIAHRAVAAALDDVTETDAPFWSFEPEELRALRHELREIAASRPVSPEPRAVARALEALQRVRDETRPGRDKRRPAAQYAAVMVGIPLGLFGFGLALAALLERVRRARPT
jgi:hypothetical protein